MVNAPLKKFRSGRISASVWENSKEKEGIERTYYSVSLDKRYKDSKGEWQSSSSFRQSDLPSAILSLQKAFEYLSLKE